MATSRRQQFVYRQTALMVGLVVAFSVFGVLSWDLFFVCSFLGFLLLVDLTAPFNVAPLWRARLRWFVVLGLLGFGYVVVQRFFGPIIGLPF